MHVTVVGCGVIGLSAAIRLGEAGHDVRVIAEDPPLATTSTKAGAVWTPTEVAPIERTFGWAVASRSVYEELAGLPRTGVAPLDMLELHSMEPDPVPWLDTPWVSPLGPESLPEGFAAGWLIRGFGIEPRPYLRSLAGRLDSGGIPIEIIPGGLSDLSEAPGELVVNCSGLGARRLADDPRVHPIRGQMVVIDNPGIRKAVSDESDPDRIAYLYPHRDVVMLGGCRQTGRDDLVEDPVETERILADTLRLEPRLAGATVREVVVGLRPGRDEVRLELSSLADGRPVIHDYGHAGSGFTLSWGCAGEVADLAGSV